MTKSRLTVAGLGAVALGLCLTTAVQGSEAFLHTNHLTFSRAVAVPGAELAAGTYIFERVVASNPDLIVVRSRDRARVYFMGNTERVSRPRDASLQAPTVTLGEARPGAPIPIVAWYPSGSTRGHRFIYPAR